MSRYAYHLAGRSFNKLGTVLNSPPAMRISGFATGKNGQKHGLMRAVGRNVTTSDRLSAIKDPILAFDQSGRNVAFLNDRAFVVLNAMNGELITTYGADDFDESIRAILSEAGFPF